MELFLDWLHDNGAVFTKIDWPRITAYGRGAIATQHISTNESILEIPFVLMMTPLHAMNDPIVGDILTLNKDIVDGDVILAIYLMYEKSKGLSSFYHPFINILPIPSSISNWSNTDLKAFQDMNIILQCKYRKNELRRLYQSVCTIINPHPSIFLKEHSTYDHFKFAYEVIQSRAFGKRLKWSALVPLADCLNHNNVQTKYDFDVNNNKTFRLFPSGGNSYAIGSEVFNSYGRRANDNLLLDYGFALMDNEWDSIYVALHLKNETADDEEIFRLKSSVLHEMRINTMNRYSLTRFNLPLDLILFFRVIALSKPQLEELNVKDLLLGRFHSLELELHAITLLIAHLHKVMNSFPTTLEEDISNYETITSSNLSTISDVEDNIRQEKSSTTLVYRITQKRIIDITCKKLDLIKRVIESRLSGKDIGMSVDEMGTELMELSGARKSAANSAGCTVEEMQEYVKSIVLNK